MSPQTPKKSKKTDAVAAAPKGAESPKEKTQRKHLSKAQKVFIGVGSAVLVLGIVSTSYAFYYQNRFLPRTYVGGTSVGGLNRSEAGNLLAAKREAFMTQPLKLTYEAGQWDVTPTELGTTISGDEQLDQVWDADKAGDWWAQLKRLFAAPLAPRSADVSIVAVSEQGRILLQEKVLGTIEKAMHETSLSFSVKEVKVVPGNPGERLNQAAFEDGLADAFKKGKNTLALSLSPANSEVTTEMAESARLRAVALLEKTTSVKLASETFSVESTKLADWLATDVERDAAGNATGLKLTLKSGLNEAIKEWSAKVNREPVNVKLAQDGAGIKVVEVDKDGQAVDEAQTVAAFTSYLNGETTPGSVTGVVVTTRAEVRPDTLAALGIKELVGTNTTDFSGSPTNRAFNIKKGASELTQKLVKNGEIFSTMGTLGPIEVSTGYLPELVIKGNRTTPEAGGGLCQVSTTLFRAVLNAGLPIEARQNHAYRVGYYERGVGPGLDATIYDPNPDFKWKNDLGSAVFVQSSVVGTKVTFELFGTKDGRVSSIGAPTILAEYKVGTPIYAETDTLPKGTTKQVETAHDGAKTSVDYKVTRNGEQIYSKTFISVYKAWPAQYLVGTKEVAASVPTPNPETTPTPSP